MKNQKKTQKTWAFIGSSQQILNDKKEPAAKREQRLPPDSNVIITNSDNLLETEPDVGDYVKSTGRKK